jgi:hypothetical protein
MALSIATKTRSHITLQAGWPDWANFRPLDDSLLRAVAWKLQKYPTYLGCFFQWLSLVTNVDKKSVGLHFGWLFSQTHLVTLFASLCHHNRHLSWVSLTHYHPIFGTIFTSASWETHWNQKHVAHQMKWPENINNVSILFGKIQKIFEENVCR